MTFTAVRKHSVRRNGMFRGPLFEPLALNE